MEVSATPVAANIGVMLALDVDLGLGLERVDCIKYLAVQLLSQRRVSLLPIRQVVIYHWPCCVNKLLSGLDMDTSAQNVGTEELGAVI